jgi:hypothetical protein
MEDNHYPIIELKNKEIPESIIKEVDRIQVRITELEDLRITLRASSDYQNNYMKICRRIQRIIHAARDGILVMNDYDGHRDPDSTERAFLNELQDRCWRLWDNPLKIE